MAHVVNGKGDTYRPVDSKKFRNNYDEIKWKSKEKKEDKSTSDKK